MIKHLSRFPMVETIGGVELENREVRGHRFFEDRTPCMKDSKGVSKVFALLRLAPDSSGISSIVYKLYCQRRNVVLKGRLARHPCMDTVHAARDPRRLR